MNVTTSQRTAKGGTLRSFRLDPVSLARLALLERIANEYFETKATASTIIRRALDLLEYHYITQKAICEANPETTAGLKEMECWHLRTVNAGKDPYGIRVEDVMHAPVLKQISDLAKEKNADKPRLIDEIRRDLKRWGVAIE